MLLWLIVVSVALAVADAQDPWGGGADKRCMELQLSRTEIFCPNLRIYFNKSRKSPNLRITCVKGSSKIVCEELLYAKPFIDEYLDPSKKDAILNIFEVKKCVLSRETLACALGLVRAVGSDRVRLTDVVGPLEAAHLQGLKGVTSIDISYNEASAFMESAPYDIFFVLQDLQRLTIRGSSIKLTSMTSSTLSKLNTLILQDNRIKMIPKGSFKRAPEIQELDLSSNRIEFIDVDAFEGLTKLVILTLKENPLNHLPEGVFRHTPNIARLDLGQNKLLDLSDDLFVGLNKLQKFFISKNSEVLKLKNKTFSNLPSLSELRLDESRIEHVPAELLRNSTNLKVIILKRNNITYLPKTIFKSLKLTILNLSYNGISFLYSDVFSEQTSMTELDLSYNMLKSLPDGLFSDTHSLQYIYLNDNSIDLLTKSIFEGLYNLKMLSLSSNQIENISQWIFECSSSLGTKGCSFPSDAVIDLRYNFIRQLEPPVDKNHTLRVRFFLDHNPYRCDCFLYDFIFNYRRQTYMSNIDIKEAECAEPNDLIGEKLVNWQIEQLTCDVDCTTGGMIKHSKKDLICKCTLNPMQLKLDMFCDYLPNVFPELPKSISSAHLKLNNVTSIPSLPPEVKIVDVSFANLTDLVVIAESVVLNLTYNYFTKAPVKLFENNCSVYLSNNPLDCSCDGRDSLIALDAFKTFILDYKNLTCSNGIYVSNIIAVIDDLCDTSNVVIISASLGTICIVIIACILLAFMYRTELRIILRRSGLWRGDVHGGELYDAFVSYAHQDESFVIEELLPNLERGNPPLKICIHNRDWVVGEYIPAQIARSVEQSRYTIIVLTRNFVNSVWGRMEFRTAHAKDRVIVLMLEDLSADRSLDSELRAYISTKTYVKANDPLVWERLRDAVLRRKRSLKNTNKNQQLENAMATTNL